MWTTVAEISKSILYGVNESAKICGAYKLLRITDIQEDNVDWDTVPFTNYDESKVGVYLLEENDILFARTGATVGKSYLVKGLCESSIYASYLIRVQTFKEILPQYVKYFFESGFYWEQIERGSVGIGQPNVNGTTLGNLRLPIPPINEQERIVSELKKWIAVITSIEANKNDLQGYIESAKSKILDLAIHGKLVPQDPNDEPAVDLLRRINPKFTPCDNGHYTFDVPSGWITTNLGSIFNVVSAKRILKSDWKHSGVPFYRAREIAKLSIYGLVDNELYISEEHYNSLKEKFPVPKASDIMISAVGTIGKCYIVKESDKFYYKDASVLCLCNDYQINTKYIYHIMRSEYMLKQMYDNSKGTTVDTITIEKAKQYILPLPPLAEQQRIVAKIEETFSIFDGIQNSLEA